MRAITHPDSRCAVCGQKSTGWHFGAVTCRACAAFFRRSGSFKIIKECKKGDDRCAVISRNGFFNCRKCRLQKCLDVGMNADRFQMIEMFDDRSVVQSPDTVPASVSTFLGRPNFIIFNARPKMFEEKTKNVVDVEFLVQKAMLILEQGIDGPVHSKSTLGKLALGLGRVQDSYRLNDVRAMVKYGKEETLAEWEHGFLKLINWLTYFDAFRELPLRLQISIANSIWNVWNRLVFLSEAVAKIREQLGDVELKRLEQGEVLCDWSHVEFDMSWCSNYPTEQVRFFLDIPSQMKMDDLTKMMLELEPTDVELTYMLCQLSFHNIRQKHDGQVLELIDRFQDSLANDLHQYYVEELEKPCYSKRLNSMMKINNRLQQKLRENISRLELANVFDVMNCKCSHPEMFLHM